MSINVIDAIVDLTVDAAGNAAKLSHIFSCFRLTLPSYYRFGCRFFFSGAYRYRSRVSNPAKRYYNYIPFFHFRKSIRLLFTFFSLNLEKKSLPLREA